MTRTMKPSRGSKSSLNKLMRWERAYLWDYICSAAGVTNTDLVNAGYLVSQNPFKFQGDLRYNLMSGTERRAHDAMAKFDNLAKEAKSALTALGLKREGLHRRQTHYGKLVSFAWHNSAVKGGAHFTPIYSFIEDIQAKFPQDGDWLGALRRRLVFLEVLSEELESIEDLYDFGTIRTLLDWTSNLVETFASKSAEAGLLITEYYLGKVDHPRRLRFEELVQLLSGVKRIFGSINKALEGCLIVNLRNEIAHSLGPQLAIENAEPRLRMSLGKRHRVLKFGVMKPYLEESILSRKAARLIWKGTRDGHAFMVLQDPRFSYVTFEARRSKKGTFPVEDVMLRYDLDLKRFVEMESGFLFVLARELFRSIG